MKKSLGERAEARVLNRCRFGGRGDLVEERKSHAKMHAVRRIARGGVNLLPARLWWVFGCCGIP